MNIQQFKIQIILGYC